MSVLQGIGKDGQLKPWWSMPARKTPGEHSESRDGSEDSCRGSSLDLI